MAARTRETINPTERYAREVLDWLSEIVTARLGGIEENHIASVDHLVRRPWVGDERAAAYEQRLRDLAAEDPRP